MNRALVAIAILVSAGQALASDRGQLLGACFSRTYETAELALHPGQRVSAVAVHFQGFQDSLLAGVTYRLRYGTEFAFSGDCSSEIEGGFQCEACGSGSCEGNVETFKILWSGGDRLELINDTTGLFAQNAAGGRDRLQPGGAHALFELSRSAAHDCSW